jgi:YHS domain-containing protein
MKIGIRFFLLTCLFAGTAIAFAACSGADGVTAVNKDHQGLALRGFDAVAYLTVDSAVRGDPRYEFVWNGAKWYFATAENMEKFRKDPNLYAPQFGGYCSYAVSHGYTADGDPEQWKVVDGKLYLNYNQKAKEAWEKEQDKLIKDGERNWIEFQKKKPEHKG